MRFTARQKLKPFGNISRVQSEQETYDMAVTRDVELKKARDRDATIERLRAELAEAREILAGGNFGSLPNDWTLPRIAASVMEDMHKLTWQVRDTCARAETAEAALAERQGG